MEYFWWLYLATRLDTISTWFGWLTTLGVLSTLVPAIIWVFSHDSTSFRADTDEEKVELAAFRKRLLFWRNVGVVVFLLFGSLYSLTPTKRDAMFIAGGVGVIEATKAVAGSEVAKKSVQVIEAWLEKELVDLKKQGSKAADGMQKDLKDVQEKVKAGVQQGVRDAVKDAVK